MSLGTVVQLVNRLNTKFGNLDAELAGKLDPPVLGDSFNPAAIDFSIGQLAHPNYTQTAQITLAIDPLKTPVTGSSVEVNITGGGFPLTFSSPFTGLEGLVSGLILSAGVDYTFLFRFVEDWAEVAPGVFEDRVLVIASGLRLGNAGVFNPTVVNLTGALEYVPYTQSGTVAFALADVDEVPGSYVFVQFTGVENPGNPGNPYPITWSSEFAEIQGGTLTTGDYAGFIGSRRLVILWSAAQGKALVALSGEGGGGTMSANEILTSLQSLGSPVPGFNADLLDGLNSLAFATAVQGGKADTALQAPTRLTQTGDFALQSVISTTAGVRHNTMVELTGTADQTVDLSTLAADAYVAISDNHGASEKRLTGSSNMRAVGHPDEPFNPRHTHVFLAPWGTASVDYKHSAPLARVSGAILQLPHGAGINPVTLSPSTIDFDANAAGKLTLTGATPNKVSTWTDTLSVLAVAPTQGTTDNRPHILGTAGATDYRVSFDSTALASSSLDLFASNTIVLPATGFTFYFAGAYGLRSATTSFHSWGLAPSCFRLRITTGDATSAPFSVQFQSPSEPSLRTVLFLDDFAWRNQQKFCAAISFNDDAGSTVTAFGFHSGGGAERGSSTWVKTTITATELRLGAPTGILGSFGYIQQYGMSPRPSSDMEMLKVLRFLQIKWAI